MNRSKNHVLYELYLEEANAPELFEKTQRFSLSHIVKFVELYDQLRDGQTAQEILLLATGEHVGSIEDMNDRDFNLYSSFKHLYRSTTSVEVDLLDEVITKINDYHASKKAE